jgi:hypothetical protein
VLHDITLLQQVRLQDGRKQFLAELTALPSFLLPHRQLCYIRQHSAIHTALFLQSTFSSPVSSVPPVNIPLLLSTLFLQSTFRSCCQLCSPSQHSAHADLSVPSCKIPHPSQLCFSRQHSDLFLQSTVRSPNCSVPSDKIPLTNRLCSFSQLSALQAAVLLQSTFGPAIRTVPPVNILISNPHCEFSTHSALQFELFLQLTSRLQVRTVPVFNIPLSSPH